MRRWRRQYDGPLVSKRAVQQFLSRDLESFDWIKKIPKKELLDGIDLDFPVDPFVHQAACFNIGMERRRFLFFLDMGAGKSKLTLDLIRWHKKHSKAGPFLICVPMEVNVGTWIEEIAIHAPDLSYVSLLGDGRPAMHNGRRGLLHRRADLYLVTYPALQTFMSRLVRKTKRKRVREIDEKAALKFADLFDGVIFDESHRLGIHTSLFYRQCRRFTKRARFVYALTGTPFGRDPMKLWSQFHVVDDGETLGKTLGLFRASFFNAKRNYWGALEYTFDRSMRKDLRRMIKHRSILYEDSEVGELPPISHHKIIVPFSKTAQEQYNILLHRIRKARGNVEELKNAYHRSRMLTSGFLSVKNELGDRLTQQFDEQPKLDALQEKLGDIEGKALIYHDYIFTGDLICEMLERIFKGTKITRLDGQTKDPIKEYHAFLRSDSARWMVANSQAGTGINPQSVCRYGFFFESPSSPITRRQCEKRLHRTGQKYHVHLYDLVVRGSVDEKILGFIKEGHDLYEAILGGKGRKAFFG